MRQRVVFFFKFYSEWSKERTYIANGEKRQRMLERDRRRVTRTNYSLRMNDESDNKTVTYEIGLERLIPFR